MDWWYIATVVNTYLIIEVPWGDIHLCRGWNWVLELVEYASYTASRIPRHIQFSSVQSFSRVWLFVTQWTAACQASLSINNSWSPPKPMSIVSVIPSNHLILCRLLLLLPSIFPSIRVLSNESALCIRWPKYWSLKHFSPTGRLLAVISIVYSYLWQVGAKGNGILSPFNYKFVGVPCFKVWRIHLEKQSLKTWNYLRRDFLWGQSQLVGSTTANIASVSGNVHIPLSLGNVCTDFLSLCLMQ